MYINTHLRNGRNGEKGSILVLGALSLILLTAFMGLALDASYMYFHKRTMQTAADAGAYAGALEKMRNSGNEAAAAKNDTALNGFTDGTDNVAVTVNNPPKAGSQVGNSSFVEVVVTHPQPTWFMRVLSFNSVTVAARAVAGVGGTGNGCVYALNQDTSNSNNGFFANGTTNSSFSCGVFSNSNFRVTGGGCVVTPTVSYNGTYSNSNTSGNCGPANVGQGVPIVDPLASKYSIPSYSKCDQTGYTVNSKGTTTIPPGVYCGGITINGAATSVVFSPPGNYILVGGGMSITSGVNVSGTGVTFFNTYDKSNKYGAISINGGSGTVITLTAPTSGTYKALLFYQDPTVSWAANNGSTIGGSGTAQYDGMIYFPTTDLTYAGTSGTTTADTTGSTMLVGYNVKIAGTATVNADYATLGGSNPLQNVLFAE
jgi:hypothetical protein